jgi:hypothetical protein
MRAALVSVAAAVEFEYGTLSAAAHLLIDAAAELGPRQMMIGMLPEALLMLARAELFLGRFRHAAATATEGLRLVEDTGQAPELGFHGLVLAPIAAMQGEEGRCHGIADGTIAAATECGLTAAVAWSRHSLALLDLGLGRYDSAFVQLGDPEPARHQLHFTG